MKRIIPIVGLGLGAGTSAAIAMIRRRRDDLRRGQNNRCSMTTVAGIFISAPHDGQIYVAERSRCHSDLGTFATSPMSALRPPSGQSGHRPAIA
jgi:hypothetical protein